LKSADFFDTLYESLDIAFEFADINLIVNDFSAEESTTKSSSNSTVITQLA
jgi:hypothetical protein